MCVFVSRPMKIVTFLRKNNYCPKRVVDFPLERDTFRNKIMEIVEDFDEKSYNNNGKSLKSSRILRVNPFFSFFFLFSSFFYIFRFFHFFIFLISHFLSIFSIFFIFHFFLLFIFSFFSPPVLDVDLKETKNGVHLYFLKKKPLNSFPEPTKKDEKQCKLTNSPERQALPTRCQN